MAPNIAEPDVLAEHLENLRISTGGPPSRRDDNKGGPGTTPPSTSALLHTPSLPDSPVEPDHQFSTRSEQFRKRGPRKSAPELFTRTSPPADVLTQPRAASEPPQDIIENIRCTAIAAQTGVRCRNSLGPKSSGTYCYVHVKKVMGDPGFFSHRRSDAFVGFEVWIPRYLTIEAQLKLRAAMARPALGMDDTPGYVYAFEIISPAISDHVQVKVGYSENMVKRLDEWKRQCPSKTLVFRGSWPPSTPVDGEGGDQYINGVVNLPGGMFKLEKAVKFPTLIHAELEDVASNSLHLSPEFMAGGQATGSPRKLSKVKRKACTDCGKVHREIFSFKRVTSGPLKGKEWESVVKPIMDKWGSFVADYV